MTSWLGNQGANMYDGVSAPVAATQDALAERLENVRETTSILNNRIIFNMDNKTFHEATDKMEETCKLSYYCRP